MFEVAFIQNLQIIYPIEELSNFFSQKYMNVPDGTKLFFPKSYNLNT